MVGQPLLFTDLSTARFWSQVCGLGSGQLCHSESTKSPANHLRSQEPRRVRLLNPSPSTSTSGEKGKEKGFEGTVRPAPAPGPSQGGGAFIRTGGAARLS